MSTYPSPPNPASHTSWSHVGFALVLVAFNSAISQVLRLRIGNSLVIAALRCIAQLSVVAIVLRHILVVKKPWAALGLALLLSVLSAFEIVVIKANRRCRFMFPAVLVAILVSTIPVSILGTHFAMEVAPFWTPEQYLPVVGVLCGNTITGISLSLGHILKELDENLNSTETPPGALRPDAYHPLIVEALRLGLMPIINQMSVMGTIAIPGNMIYAMLDGSDVAQEARQQMITVFMIAASNALSCIVATHLVLRACIDSEHRIRTESIDAGPHAVFRGAKSIGIQALVSIAGHAWTLAIGRFKRLLPEVRGPAMAGTSN